MRITLLAVGKLKVPEWRRLAASYTERITRQAKLELIELRDADRARESERLLASLEKLAPDACFLLAEEGRALTSRQLAGQFEATAGGHLAFVIGGAYGMSPELKQKGRLLSLSPMTFPHEMARVILLEQMYRALSILAGSGYHHD